MTSKQEEPSARRSRIERAVKHTDADPSAGNRLRKFLEEPLLDPANGDLFPLLEPGSSTPTIVVKRTFYSEADGKQHHGLFDPEGDPSDLPFKTSEWAK